MSFFLPVESGLEGSCTVRVRRPFGSGRVRGLRSQELEGCLGLLFRGLCSQREALTFMCLALGEF